MSRAQTPSETATQTRRLMFATTGLAVIDFRCRAHVEPEGPEEPNPTHSIALVRRGAFRRTRERTGFLADPNSVLFFNAGDPYRYAHPIPGGDDCTILAVSTDRALKLVAHHAPAQAGDPATPFRIPHGLASQRVARLHYEVLALLRRGAADLALEDALLDLADEAVRAVYADPRGPTGRAAGTAAVHARWRELVEATKVAINARLDRPPSLGDLARAAGCSPFHLSRTFRRMTGESLRRYAGRLRARVAADRLAAGVPDLTDLALDLGYPDHSHFTNRFRHEWGMPPSRFRARAGGG
jgi:AraC-like DNA-binding protein